MDKHHGYSNQPYSYLEPQSYDQLVHYLAQGVRKANTIDRPIANNTRVIKRTPTTIAIKLHNTDIITFFENGSIQLNTDGWKTVTTKDRMSRFLPTGINVYSEKFLWYLSYNKKRYLYEDHMIITHDGHITNANGNAIKEHSKAKEKKKRNQLKKIDNYIRKFMEALQSGKVPAPGYSDCWVCQAHNGQPIADKMSTLKLIDGQPELIPFNEKPWTYDCIRGHIKENYFVPTLLINAIKSEFYDQEGIWGNPNMTYGLSDFDKHNISCWFHSDDTEHKPMVADMTVRRLKKAMKQFITKQLNF